MTTTIDIPTIPLGWAESGIEGFFIRPFEDYRVLYTRPYPTGLLHRHLHFEVFWISGGTGIVLNDFERITVGRGTLLVFAPGDVHAWIRTRRMSGYLLGFSDRFLDGAGGPGADPLRPALWRSGAPLILRPDAVHGRAVVQLLREIREESLSSDPGRAYVLQSLVGVLVHKIARLRPEDSPVPEAAVTQRFRRALQTECPRLGTVKQFAQHLGISRSLLHREVRRDAGRAPSDLIHERLLLEAKRRLRHSQATLADIARQLGFSDASYFGRFFLRHAGQTPRAFRSGGSIPALFGIAVHDHAH